jgi:hypothetical protein
VSRHALAEALRTQGFQVSNARASTLLRILKAERGNVLPMRRESPQMRLEVRCLPARATPRAQESRNVRLLRVRARVRVRGFRGRASGRFGSVPAAPVLFSGSGRGAVGGFAGGGGRSRRGGSRRHRAFGAARCRGRFRCARCGCGGGPGQGRRSGARSRGGSRRGPRRRRPAKPRTDKGYDYDDLRTCGSRLRVQRAGPPSCWWRRSGTGGHGIGEGELCAQMRPIAADDDAQAGWPSFRPAWSNCAFGCVIQARGGVLR